MAAGSPYRAVELASLRATGRFNRLGTQGVRLNQQELSTFLWSVADLLEATTSRPTTAR